MFGFIKYALLCLKVGWLEFTGKLTKEEGDAIVWDYLNDR